MTRRVAQSEPHHSKRTCHLRNGYVMRQRRLRVTSCHCGHDLLSAAMIDDDYGGE